MKRIIGFLLLTAFMQQVIGQTGKFDIATYTTLKGWKKDSMQGVISFTITNPSTGGYCVIGLYAAKASIGTPEKDFAGEWNDLAVIPFAAEKNPKSEIQTTTSGWKALAATAPITYNGSAAYILLTTFSGFGKMTSVIATLNDKAYIASIDSFLENLRLDKNATIASVPTNQNNQPKVVNTGSIVGTWSDQSHVLSSYVNSSGGYIGDASISSVTQYEFKADKTFIYSFLGISSRMIVRTEARGTYSMNGKNLILKTTFYKSGYANDMKEDKSKEISETWQFYIGPNKWEAGPFLNLHKDGNYYVNNDYQYDYYKRLK
jgi:hypothetical protein